LVAYLRGRTRWPTSTSFRRMPTTNNSARRRRGHGLPGHLRATSSR
jgi:hypothetical protein